MRFNLPRAALLVTGLALAVAGVRGVLNRDKQPPGRVSPPVRTAEEAERWSRELDRADQEVLAGGTAADRDRVAALLRLARKQDLKARERALEWSRDRSQGLREAAAMALGQFDDGGSLAALVTLCSDPVRSVRLRAVEAMGERPGEGRVDALRSLGGGGPGDPGFAILRDQSLYRAASGAGAETIRADALRSLLRKGFEGVSVAAILAPQSPETLEALRAVVRDSRQPHNDPSAARALRQLAVTGDPWLRKALAGLWKAGGAELRRAVIEAIPAACPEERWEILGEALRSQDAELRRTAVDGLSAMPGPKAKALLKSSGAEPAPTGPEGAKNAPDLCEGKAAR